MKRKNKVFIENKPLYKMKQFLKINSKMKDHLSNFKTYLPLIKPIRCSNKAERDINLNDSNNMKNTSNTVI